MAGAAMLTRTEPPVDMSLSEPRGLSYPNYVSAGAFNLGETIHSVQDSLLPRLRGASVDRIFKYNDTLIYTKAGSNTKVKKRLLTQINTPSQSPWGETKRCAVSVT